MRNEEFSSVMYYTRRESGTGGNLVADIEELEEMDASEIHAGRLHAKEVLAPKMVSFFLFSRWQVEQSNYLE